MFSGPSALICLSIFSSSSFAALAAYCLPLATTGVEHVLVSSSPHGSFVLGRDLRHSAAMFTHLERGRWLVAPSATPCPYPAPPPPPPRRAPLGRRRAVAGRSGRPLPHPGAGRRLYTRGAAQTCVPPGAGATSSLITRVGRVRFPGRTGEFFGVGGAPQNSRIGHCS